MAIDLETHIALQLLGDFQQFPLNLCSQATLLTGVLIWCYGTTVGTRATYSGAKHEISGARACL